MPEATLSPTDAMILLVPVLPIAIWAALSDLKRMKIPNTSVLAMAAVWPLLGWYVAPTLTVWATGAGTGTGGYGWSSGNIGAATTGADTTGTGSARTSPAADPGRTGMPAPSAPVLSPPTSGAGAVMAGASRSAHAP